MPEAGEERRHGINAVVRGIALTKYAAFGFPRSAVYALTKVRVRSPAGRTPQTVARMQVDCPFVEALVDICFLHLLR